MLRAYTHAVQARVGARSLSYCSIAASSFRSAAFEKFFCKSARGFLLPDFSILESLARGELFVNAAPAFQKSLHTTVAKRMTDSERTRASTVAWRHLSTIDCGPADVSAPDKVCCASFHTLEKHVSVPDPPRALRQAGKARRTSVSHHSRSRPRAYDFRREPQAMRRDAAIVNDIQGSSELWQGNFRTRQLDERTKRGTISRSLTARMFAPFVPRTGRAPLQVSVPISRSPLCRTSLNASPATRGKR